MSEENDKVLCNIYETTSVKSKCTKNILDEDEYTEKISNIIERDFFPDLKKLRTQKEYLEAVENNDVVKIRALQKKYCRKNTGSDYSSICKTPQTFETPSSTFDSCSNSEPNIHDSCQKKKEDKKQNLDKFLANNTSEDNASFKEIMDVAEQKQIEKYAWLHDKEKEHSEKYIKGLALPSIEEQFNEKRAITSSVDNWQYTNRNSVMYVPNGVDLSANEKIKQDQSREINHKNTRYVDLPFNESANKSVINETAAIQAKNKEGKVGVDGKEVILQSTPNVNGFSFVNPEPSPAPGVDESPLITWGEIEGTPFRLDGSDTPLPKRSSEGPTFKIPDLSKKEKIAHSLAENVMKRNAKKKEQALQQVRQRLRSSSPMFGLNSPSSPFDRLSHMSPAARSLANNKLGISKNTDKSLRASYTPSPHNKSVANGTPTFNSSKNTPKFIVSTPDSSLTDNLLHIPKRMKASEFF